MNKEDIKEKYKKINKYVSYGTTVDTDFDIKTNGVNKNDNYTLTIKFDADIEDYLKNIEKITFIESYKKGSPEFLNKTEYINSLIRKDFIETLGLNEETTADELLLKWLEYKKENNIK